jgi:ketosteroid isomerase-like protein
MSQENVETVRRGLDIFNRRDKAAWLTICDPELENRPSGDWPETAPARGADAVWDTLVAVAEAFDGAEFEWGELIAAGRDKIVGNQRAETRGKTSGAGVLWSFWVVFTLREGKLLRQEWFADRAAALEAAGLRE